MNLPRALSAWTLELADWPLELALVLEPALARLSLALGHMPRQRAHVGGAPDGYGGLARRGHYERLVMTEWLYAEEAPEEFLRRAAQSEHLFLELARREPAEPAREIALFDAGPGQLGGPRIAQLAALIVLAARARAAGVPFAWGIVQAPEQGLCGDVNPHSVRRFLAARTALVATDVHARAWQPHLPRGPGDELWLVGEVGLADLGWARRSSSLAISDELEPGRRRLLVSVTSQGREYPPVALELPADALAVQLVTAPFAARQPRIVRSGDLRLAAAPMHFSDDRHLIVRHVDGGLRALVLRAGGEVRAPLRWIRPPGHTPIAAGVVHGRLMVVSRATDGFVLWGPGQHLARIRLPSPARALAVPGEDEPLSPLVAHQKGALTRLWFHDADHRLLEIGLRPSFSLEHVGLRSLELHAQRQRVVALAVAYPSPDAPAPDVHLWSLGERKPRQVGHYPGLGLLRVLALVEESRPPALLVERSSGHWEVHGDRQPLPEVSGQVIGVVRRPEDLALVVLGGQKRLLQIVRRGAHPVYLGSPDDAAIVHACVLRERIAALREDGVVDLWRADGNLLFRAGSAG